MARATWARPTILSLMIVIASAACLLAAGEADLLIEILESLFDYAFSRRESGHGV